MTTTEAEKKEWYEEPDDDEDAIPPPPSQLTSEEQAAKAAADDTEWQAKQDANTDRATPDSPFDLADFDRYRAGPDATPEAIEAVAAGPAGSYEEWADYLAEKNPNKSAGWVAKEAGVAVFIGNHPDPVFRRARLAIRPEPLDERGADHRAWQSTFTKQLVIEMSKETDLAAMAEAKTPPFISLGETATMETTDEDFVVGDGILSRGQKAFVYAFAGYGKTTFVGALAASLASGQPFLGVHPVDEPRKVLFVQGELTQNEIASHGQDLLRNFADTPATENLIFWRHTQLPLPSAEQALRDAIAATEASILVLDPFNRFFRGDNSIAPEQVQAIFRMVDRLLEDEALGLAAAIITHHANVSKARMAGTYDFEGWPSTILHLDRLSPLLRTRKLTFEKMRAHESPLNGTTRIIELTDAGYVYASGTNGAMPDIPFAGPFLVTKALAELGGQAYRPDLIERTMAVAHVQRRMAQAHIAQAHNQKLIRKLDEKGPNGTAIFALPETTLATVEDE